LSNKRYQQALDQADAKVNALADTLSMRFSPVLLQIYRDYLFQKFSGDLKAVISRPSILDIIVSFFEVWSYRKKAKDVVCVQLNMFNFDLVESIVTSYAIQDRPEVYNKRHPFLFFKYFAFFLAITSCFLPSRFRKLKFAVSSGVPWFIYLIYLQQFYHFSLCSGKSRVYYFSNGSPSYARFFSNRFYEVQHGVLHNHHPIVNPVARPKGPLVVKNLFDTVLSDVPHLTVDELIKEIRLDKIGMSIAFAPLVNEQPFCAEVARRAEGTTIFYHPRSPQYNDNLSLKTKIEAIQMADIVYSGISTTIFDVYHLNPLGLRVLGCANDLIDLDVCFEDPDKAVMKLNAYYGVSINVGQLIEFIE